MTESEQGESAAPGLTRIGWIALLAALLIAASAIGYRMLSGGSEAEVPTMPDGPPTIEQLRAEAEKDPLNAAAWQELGFAYFQTGDFENAAKAYRQAIEGDKDNAVLWSSLGEARVMASERDPMPPEALDAFRRAIALDPSDPRARYFLAVKKDLDGDHAGAIGDWLALLEDTPSGAPWETDLKRTIEQVGRINDIPTAAKIAAADSARPEGPPPLTGTNAIPGPSQQQIAEASAIPPGEQRQMAEGMVESLDAKLKANPKNPDGWVMLIRSRITLGQPGLAKKALADAVAANPGEAERLRREAAALGVT